MGSPDFVNFVTPVPITETVVLECKLTGQLEDIARRRAELELERSSIEDMLATDKKQRAEVGSAFESYSIRELC